MPNMREKKLAEAMGILAYQLATMLTISRGRPRSERHFPVQLIANTLAKPNL